MIEIQETTAQVHEEALKNWLQGRLSEERFQHSLGSQHKAVELARFFKLSPSQIEKASIAGLLHDCAKLMSPKELFEACQTLEIPVTPEEKQSPQTLHPFVGAEMVSMHFGIRDEDILNAIRYHTTGRTGMSAVEKVVYIADKIEENTRNPLYTQKINSQINSPDPRTLDQVVKYILDSTITFLIDKGQIIHPRTIEARNDLVNRLKASNPTQHKRNL